MALHYRTTLGLPYGPSPTREQNIVELIVEEASEINDNNIPEEHSVQKEEVESKED